MLEQTLKEFKESTKYNEQMKDIDDFLEGWKNHIDWQK